jgi:hypothetical protein
LKDKSNYDVCEYFDFDETLISVLEEGSILIVDYLFSLKYPVSKELVAHTTKKGRISMIKKLLLHGVNISTYNVVNVSVLCGHLDILKYLIKVAKAPYSNSALVKAVKSGNFSICEYLLTLELIPKNKAISYAILNNEIKIFE